MVDQEKLLKDAILRISSKISSDANINSSIERALYEHMNLFISEGGPSMEGLEPEAVVITGVRDSKNIWTLNTTTFMNAAARELKEVSAQVIAQYIGAGNIDKNVLLSILVLHTIYLFKNFSPTTQHDELSAAIIFIIHRDKLTPIKTSKLFEYSRGEIQSLLKKDIDEIAFQSALDNIASVGVIEIRRDIVKWNDTVFSY